MKFSVYQFHMSDAAFDKVNAVGWGGDFGEFATEVEIHREVKFEGAEKYRPEMSEYFELVAEMTDISNLEEVFHVGNGYGDQSKMTRVADRMHSLSVGDIIFCHDTNTFLMCDPEGWTGISIKEAA